MTAPSAKRIPALMLVLLSIVAAFAIYDSTRMRIDRRDSTLHSPTPGVRPTATAPTLARPASTTTRTATGTTVASTPGSQSHSGDPVRTILTIGLAIVGGVTAVTLAVIVVLIQFTRRRDATPPSS
jgi:hypothetical protein